MNAHVPPLTTPCPVCGTHGTPGGAVHQALSRPTLSIIVPAYNEALVLAQTQQRLFSVLDAMACSVEVIYIDDGSRDDTPAVLAGLRLARPEVGVITLSRNFGKEMALTAGLRACRGEAVVVIDADLQDPPELIPGMLQAWQAGYDVVNMRRRSRQGETWFKRNSARAYYRTLARLSDTDIPVGVGDFRLLGHRVVAALNTLPECNRYMKGLFAWVGFRQTTIEYDRAPRAAGHAQQNYRRLWALAMEGITSFSVRPLRAALWAGMLAAATAFGLTAYFVTKTLLYGEPVSGFPTLIVAILTLGGLNLLGLGILGEYLGRLFIESKRRPLYLVAQQDLPRTAADRPAADELPTQPTPWPLDARA